MRLLTYVYGGAGGYVKAALAGEFRTWHEGDVRYALFPRRPEAVWLDPAPSTPTQKSIQAFRAWGAEARLDPREERFVFAENVPGTATDAGLIGFLASLMTSGYELDLVLVSPPGDHRLVKVAEVCQESVTWIDEGMPLPEAVCRLRSLRGFRAVLR